MFNQAILLGRLGQAPKASKMTNGGMMVNFSIATSRTWNNKAGEKVTDTEWHNIKVFGKQAEICERYLTKGKQVLVTGEIKTDQWEDKEGNKRKSTNIVAREIKFISGNNSLAGNEEQKLDEIQKEIDDDIPF